MDKNKLNHNADRGSNKQQQLYLNIAFFGVFACAALIFLLLAFDKIPPVSEHKKAEKGHAGNCAACPLFFIFRFLRTLHYADLRLIKLQ